MKRTPLTRKSELRRTPLKRTGPPARLARLPRGTAPLRRKGIRPVSAKRRAENAERARVLAALLAANPMCRRCHVRPAVDGHELTPRSKGGSVTDPENIRMVCRTCHDAIHAHPLQARAEGWLR